MFLGDAAASSSSLQPGVADQTDFKGPGTTRDVRHSKQTAPILPKMGRRNSRHAANFYTGHTAIVMNVKQMVDIGDAALGWAGSD